jgi:hypothetical protein
MPAKAGIQGSVIQARPSQELLGQVEHFVSVDLRKKIDRRMGALTDSASGTWRLLPKRVRALMAKPPEGKETCELIHSSVVQRYKWPKAGSFEPFPYRPKNASTLLDNPQPSIISELSAFRQATVLISAANVGMTSGEPDLLQNLLVGLLFRKSAAPFLARPEGRRERPAPLVDRQRLVGIVPRRKPAAGRPRQLLPRPPWTPSTAAW